MSNKDIMQESSCLAAKDCGAKGLTKLQKNFVCATKSTTTKYMTIKGLSKEIGETEEEGVITTSDIAAVFQTCAEASKDLERIVVIYNYNTAVNIPVLCDSSKDPSSGQWINKTVNLLHNPTGVTIETVKQYTHNVLKFSPKTDPTRQTQDWLLTAIKNSTRNNLWAHIDKNFDRLPVWEQDGSVYLKMIFDIVYNMTYTVIQALQKWIKTFSKNGLLKV
jgi:hypothetical protein